MAPEFVFCGSVAVAAQVDLSTLTFSLVLIYFENQMIWVNLYHSEFSIVSLKKHDNHDELTKRS